MNTPKLSTMVVLYATNMKFDTTGLANNIPLTADIIKVEKRGIVKRGQSNRDKIKHRVTKTATAVSSGFGHNSLTIVMMNNGGRKFPNKEITIKIFQNGVFHLTGVLDEAYDISCMNILFSYFLKNPQHITYISADDISSPRVISRRVVLMNYTASLNGIGVIPRERLHNTIRSLANPNIISSYDPDVYPGVKIRYGPENRIVKVFRTGKLIITGVTSHEQCIEFVNDLDTLFKSALAV
jgi:hypothetical protein